MRNSDRAVLGAILRTDFLAFLMRCFLILNPGTPFFPNWHIQALAYHLELVRTGKLRRLIINLPPRSLKSIVCSVAWPAFVLGHDPTKRLICASYSADLATKLGNDCRTIAQSAMFRSTFPKMQISQDKNTESEFTTTVHGGRLATSVGGSLTGRGGDIVIIDDPLKPQDALSAVKRERVNEWFDNTLLSRLNDKRTGAIVAVGQRLDTDDLFGTLRQGSDPWTVLSLPAIAEQDEQVQIGDDTYHFRKNGDLLHPEREPLDVLDQMRAQLGSDIFAAQYQQSPRSPGGNLIKRTWVRRYDVLPATSSGIVLQSYDTASKDGEHNSWTVCTTWYIHEGRYYLIDVLRGRFDYPTLKALAIAHAKHHRPNKILVEDTGFGTALVPELKTEGFAIIAVPVEHNKQTRISVQSAKFEAGQVLFPNSASWLEDLEAELFAFPSSRYDDQVDSISQALGHEIKTAQWTERTSEGFQKLINGIAFDSYFGRMTGRPW